MRSHAGAVHRFIFEELTRKHFTVKSLCTSQIQMLGFALRTVVCKFEYVSDYLVCLTGHRLLGTICVWIQCI